MSTPVANDAKTIVLVEHNLDAAMELVDRVLVLDSAGRQILDGPARSVIQGNADLLIELGVWLPSPDH